MGWAWGAGSQGPPAPLPHPLALWGWSAPRRGQKTATGLTRAASNPSLSGVQTPEILLWDGATSCTALPVQPAAFWEQREGRVLPWMPMAWWWRQQEARDPLPSPHTGKRGGVPASGYPGTAPSRHHRSSPAPLSRHSVGLRTRLRRTPGCGPLPKARARGGSAGSSLTPLRPSLLPSLSLRSSAQLRPSVHPPARPSVCPFLSAGLGRSGWPGGGGTALPPAGIQLSLSLLYFPLLSPLVSGRCSDLDRDFWNNNDNTVQQKWSSYPPKEFILNISPYAPYGDPRLSLK